jgi:hypothetical protein
VFEDKMSCHCSLGEKYGDCALKGKNSLEQQATKSFNKLDAVRASAKDKLNPVKFLTGSAGITQLLGKAIQILMYPIGVLVMALYIWSGFLWMTASGKSEKIEQSKKIIVYTTIGAIITYGSFVLVKYVFDILG